MRKTRRRIAAGMMGVLMLFSTVSMPELQLQAEESEPSVESFFLPEDENLYSDDMNQDSESSESQESSSQQKSEPESGNESQETDESGSKESKDESEYTNGLLESQTSGEGESETEDEVDLNEPQIANSWRFSNGQLIIATPFTEEDPNAWTKVNGQYINNLGDPISGAVARGIDVSSFQGNIDWEKVQQDDVSFAIIRAGWGNDQEDQDDEYWVTNASACENLGIPYGVYFYSYAVNEKMVESEAKHTIRLLEGRNPSLPIYLDLEQDELEELEPEELAANVKLYFELLAKAGYTNVGVYANKDWFENVLTDPYFDTVNKWVAHYNPQCTYEGDYSYWQATNTGSIAGIDGNVDIDFEIDPDYVPETPDEPETNESETNESETNESETEESEEETEPSVEKNKVEITEYDAEKGIFTVKISNIAQSIVTEQVYAAVWSADGEQDDIIWHVAEKRSDGYYAEISVADHGYDSGKYFIHGYAGTSNGMVFLNDITLEVQSVNINILNIGEPDGSKVDLSLTNADAKSGDRLYFAVWGAENAQNDIVWYEGTASGNNTWTGAVDLNNHGETGSYFVHVYKQSNGQMIRLTTGNFQVETASSGSVAVTSQDKENGIFSVTASGISSPFSISKVYAAVWSNRNGQDDMKWYVMSGSSGTYTQQINMADHGYDSGLYYVHIYIETSTGTMIFVDDTTADVSEIERDLLTSSVDGSQQSVVIDLKNTSAADNSKIYFAVWGAENAQNDIIWYEAGKVSQGEWKTTVNISRHKEAGNYFVHVYESTSSGEMKRLTTGEFNIEGISGGTLSIENIDESRGSFTARLSGVSSPAGIGRVLIPVWSEKDGQDDIQWYEAKKDGDSWIVNVSFSNHEFDTGKYYAHAYAYDGRGISACVGQTSTEVTYNKGNSLIISVSDDESEVKITYIKNMDSTVKNIYFPVWSADNNQSDIVWYKAAKLGDSAYQAVVKLSNHGNSGKYYVDAYAERSDGSMNQLDRGTFEISGITAAGVTYQVLDETSGKVRITVSGINTMGSVTAVQIPTWTDANAQDDIVWYSASKSGDSWYADIEARNHGFEKGIYISHVYVTDSRGVRSNVGQVSYELNPTKIVGFFTSGGKTYYYDDNGIMVKGSRKIDGNTYYFDDATGEMVTNGWRYVWGYKRYFTADGIMDDDVTRLVTGPYYIKVYKPANYVIVFARSSSGEYDIPVKAMICSCGNPTPTGTYYTPNKFRWLTMVGGSKAQWCTQILGDYLFHSVPYRIADPTTLYVDLMYNWLGTTQSLGCIRLQAGDAKWIYDNCDLGTRVYISPTETTGPIDKPAFEPLPSWHTWDPTDPTTQYLCKQYGCH